MMGMGEAVGGVTDLAGKAMGAVGGAIKGVTGMIGGMIGGGKRRREQAAAQKEFDIQKARYENLDTSNLAANMENTYEDLTVNTQAAEFAGQQQQQALANTMGGMNAAAGGSGIAALAQAMAGQQSQNLQGASASIGQQESRNQMAAARGAADVQSAGIQGAQQSRAAELDKTETLLGMSQERLGAANEARQKATDAMISGIGDMAGGSMAAAGVAAENEAGGGDGGVGGVFQSMGFGG